MDEHAAPAEPRHIDDQQEIGRQIILPKFRRVNSGISDGHNFPGAFTFATREECENRRLESVVWLDVSNTERILEHGEELASLSRDRQLSKSSATLTDELDQYEGYVAARAGEIRAELPFDVFHWPEGKWPEHCHLELLSTYVEFLTKKASTDGAQIAGKINSKNGRVLAVELLLALFEGGGFYRKPHFDCETLTLVA